MKKSIAELEQLRQKESIVFQNMIFMFSSICLIHLVWVKNRYYWRKKNPDQLKLPKWVNVSKKRSNEIMRTITKAKNDWLKTNVDGREITLDNAESLLKGAASRKINGSHFQKEYNNIVDDVEIILQKSMFTRSQNRMVEVLSLLGEITKLKDKKIDEQPDTTDMPELESEEPAGQKSSELVVNYQFF